MNSVHNQSTKSDRASVWYVLFGLLVALTGVLFYVLCSKPAADAAGLSHPSFQSLKTGGSAVRHQAPIIWWGLAYAVLQYGFLVTSLLLGLSRIKPAIKFIALFGSVCIAACVMLFAFYESSSKSDLEIVLGFPTSTAWLVYVLWPLPVLFIVLYCLKFDDWFYPPENQQRFEQLLVAQQESERG